MVFTGRLIDSAPSIVVVVVVAGAVVGDGHRESCRANAKLRAQSIIRRTSGN